MSTPLRELRDLRRVAPLSNQGGRNDNDIDAKRAASEHAAATAASTVAGAESASRRACGTIDERAVFAGYGAARAFSASAASAESSRRAIAAERTSLAFPLPGGAVVPYSLQGWRAVLARQQVLARHKPKPALSRMKAIERLEWRLEELLVREKRRVSREQLMAMMRGMPLTNADVEYILSGATRTDRALDRCFELMGEERNDGIRDKRAIRRA